MIVIFVIIQYKIQRVNNTNYKNFKKATIFKLLRLKYF